MAVTGKRGGWLAVVVAALMSGCAVFAPTPEPIEYLPQDPPPGAVPHGKRVYVDDGRCPDAQVKRIVGGDAKRNIPRQVECVPRPQ